MAKVNSLMRTTCHPMEVRGGVSRAHKPLKKHAQKWLAENRADFDRVKRVLFIEEF